MWIQALTYLRDKEGLQAEECLKQALMVVVSFKILSPLLVIEIVQAKNDLTFKIFR